MSLAVGAVRRFLMSNGLLATQPFISKVVAYVVIPLYTLHLTPAEFGNVEYVLAIGVFFKTFISMSTTSSFWKFINEKNLYKSEQVVFSVLIIPIFFGSIIITILLFTKLIAPEFMDLNVLIYCFSEIISIFYMVVNLVIRNSFNATRFLLITFLYVLSFVSSSYLFVGILELKEGGVFYSYLLSSILVATGSLSILRKHVVCELHPKLIRKIVSYSLPLMMTNMVVIIAGFNDRILIKLLQGEEQLGIYMYGVKFSALIRSLFIDVFFILWNPIRWKVYHMDSGKKIFSSLSRVLFIVFLLSGFAWSSFSTLVGTTMLQDNSYAPGLIIIPVVTFGHVFFAMYYFSVMGLLFTEKTKIILYISLIVVVVSITLNALLIPLLGFYGSALAGLGSNLLMFQLGEYFSQRYYPIDRFRKRNVGIIVCYVLTNFVLWRFEVKPQLEFMNLIFVAFSVIVNLHDIQILYRSRKELTNSIINVS
jgi:O-antigen/teichoic acid export membrane protein